MEGVLYKYPIKHILRTVKFLPTWGCCGLEVQKPTQALKSVKGPGNIFD
jgi:hypothetical protein